MTKSSYAKVNPCKMCQPLGSIFAFKGIADLVVLLHGTQGCATYMRRQMMGHYNEPIDVASSALDEKGAVYGGEKNLFIGLKNVLKTYKPSMIGVPTTCLAETIGDDLKGMIRRFIEDEGLNQTIIIPVSTPSYMGSPEEGFQAALLSLVQALVKEPQEKEKHINFITTNISPGDARYWKGILREMEVEAVFLPDTSESLDAPFTGGFVPIPKGGTTKDEIEKMGGARATLQMKPNLDQELTAGYYLGEHHKVPCQLVPIPIGLIATDEFLKGLQKVSGQKVSSELKLERGRLLDTMVDAHKALFNRRIAIYGDSELVEALTAFSLEIGLKPVVIASGSGNQAWESRIKELVFSKGVSSAVASNIDFDWIALKSSEMEVELFLGNSDGYNVSAQLEVPLVRVGFPIDDRLGGQRQQITGYTGGIWLINEVANTFLAQEQRVYRQETKDRLWTGGVCE